MKLIMKLSRNWLKLFTKLKKKNTNKVSEAVNKTDEVA